MDERAARRVLATYARSRLQKDEALRVLYDTGVTIADLARLSSLSRKGIEQILARTAPRN